jgi:serine/threonine protein kinase
MQPSSQLFSPYPQAGEVLDGKYRVEKMLGEGGMGAVAKATHLLRRAPVALKFMSGAILSMPGTVERFVNEGVAASQIDSDHVVKVYDVGRLPSGAPYLVMEFLDGRDLSDVLLSEGPRLAPPRAVHFCLQMLRALHTAHTAGIVHRDMKPSNCFVIEKDGEPDFLKLVDFGISKVRVTGDDRASNLTRTNSALGTPLYMSPEQARSPRDVDARSDLYSVGAILYEMLGGRTPYTAESGEYTEILFKIFTTEPEPLQGLDPALPDGLVTAVHRALTRDRDARFATALDMAEALAPFADERSNEVVMRMRAVRGRSIAPGALPPMSRAAPPFPSQPQDGAAAQSLPPMGPEALRAPRVPTDVGLSRSAAGIPRTTGAPRRAAVIGAFVAIAAVALLAIAGLLVVRGRAGTTGSSAPAGATTAIATASPSPLLLLPASAIVAPSPSETIFAASPSPSPPPAATGEPSSVVLAPAPSLVPALAHGSGSPSASAGDTTLHPSPRPLGSGALPTAPSTQLPTQLGDLKLH